MAPSYLVLAPLVRTLWQNRRGAVLALGCLIVLSTAVLVSVEAALVSIEDFRTRAASALGGDADFEIWNGRVGVPLSVRDELLQLPAVAGATALDWARAEHVGSGQSLFLIGVAAGRGYQPVSYRLHAGDVPLGDDAVVRGLFLEPERVADWGLTAGESVTLRLRGRERTLPLAGTLTAPQLDAFGGSAALVPLRELSESRGIPVSDRILIRVATTASQAEILALRQLATRYGELRRPGFGSEYASGFLTSAKIAVRAVLAWLLVLVCVAVYALARLLTRDSHFVATRDVFQALSPTHRDLLACGALVLTVIPFLLVGALGSAVLLQRLRSGLISPLGFFEGIGPLPVLFGAGGWMQSLFAVIAILILSLWLGVRGSPRSSAVTAPVLRNALLSALVLAAGAAGWLLRAFDPGITPLLIIYVLGAMALVAVIGSITVRPQRLLSRLFALMIPRLSAGMELLRRAAPGNRLVVSAAGVSLFALMTGLLVIGDSVSGSMERWVRDRLPGATVLTLGSPYAMLSEDLPSIPADWVEEVRNGVRGAELVQSVATSLSFRGEEVGVSARDYANFPVQGRLSVSDTSEAALRRGLRAGGVAISSAFARRFGISPGETLSLATHRGPRNFSVVGRVQDFSGPAGSIQFDLHHFEQHWLRSGPSGLLLWSGGLPAREAQAAAGGPFTRLHREKYEAYSEFAERSRTGSRPLLRVLVAAGLAALIGLLVALVVLDVGTQAESFRLLQRLGGSASGIAAAYVVELAITLGLAAAAGLLLGVALAIPTLGLLERTLGWSVKPMISAAPFAAVALTVCLTSALAGVALLTATRFGFPARRLG